MSRDSQKTWAYSTKTKITPFGSKGLLGSFSHSCVTTEQSARWHGVKHLRKDSVQIELGAKVFILLTEFKTSLLSGPLETSKSPFHSK